MNKKIGILTFSYSTNPGSVLQAYALQKTISDMDGFSASMINYSKTFNGKPIYGKTVFCKPFRSWTPKKVMTWCGLIITYPMRISKYKNFFKSYYNGFDEKSYSREDLPHIADNYDKFVVGSDQVWNYGSAQVDDTYFLDFVEDNSKKISYAASFGQKDISEEYRKKVADLISAFSSISVREPDGLDIVSKLAGREATLVLDPSLLLDKYDYRRLSTPPKKKGYVFLYLRENSPSLELFAKRLAKEKGLKVVKVFKHWLCGKNGVSKTSLDPHKWLGYIDNADYVVTNSFHGICFSTIFEKEFFVGLLNNVAATNPRIEGVLKQFGFKNRFAENINDFNTLETIDYKTINEFLVKRREESLRFLKDALEQSEEK